ncbi:MAG TPA: aminoglycoside phosphotransferase family protein [Ferruginibacter sp.]|nr:aminoglycoside phosphotransferase family protein [Bacteroidota bacterium]MBS1926872.1 aminoglycoside phosphotransferase family protein [Bacteroidota bacterium]MCC6692101.1 aminoglycoside phosphotransferase family protein [Chitinophagaceae bacterium]HMT95462.1 aminoglycoside phosphotransferase family protein [Ferruginibacter sp.]HMU24612.1 aminoglycoside phosphotransferase family protein [Ferruginibacter sp.]
MDDQLLQQAVSFYGKPFSVAHVFGSGLINHTWKLSAGDENFIFQKINTEVFKQPGKIDENLQILSVFFAQQHPGYLFTAPLKGKNGHSLLQINYGYYRCFVFVKNSHTVDVVQTTSQAYEAAAQFGKFTTLLNDFDAKRLHITLPDFHNLALRYQQFETAMNNGNTQRIAQAVEEISFLQSQKTIVEQWQKFIAYKEARQRVTHHDTKISNVLFDENNKGICVIDLDTVMPGYYISDVGDMLRTYICPFSEEEKDLDKITVRKEFVQAVQQGYFAQMQNNLSAYEQDHFYFSGEFIIFMQALRFLTDYLNNDAYYGRKYETHNWVRAKNQVQLLKEFQFVL